MPQRPNGWRERFPELGHLLRDWGIALAITVAAVLTWQLLAPKPATEGLAPPLVTERVDGGSFDLTNRSADAYVINFWATWCAPCRREIPEFSRFADANPRVEVYGVSVDAELAAPQLAAASMRLGIHYPVLHDADQHVAADWGVKSFPTTFVLNRDREIVAVQVGVVDEALLDQMLARAR